VNPKTKLIRKYARYGPHRRARYALWFGVPPLLTVYREIEIHRAICAALGLPAELLRDDGRHNR